MIQVDRPPSVLARHAEEQGNGSNGNGVYNMDNRQDGRPTSNGSIALNTEMRHGFEDEYTSQKYMDMLANTFYSHYDMKRHTTSGNPTTDEEKRANYKYYQPMTDWKIMKDRQKTTSAALVLCLNIGVPPPDVVRTDPCCKTETWVDPTAFPDTKKAMEKIGKNLQSQYETLSQRTRYKQSLDPSVEDVKRFCNTLRRNAKDERILFHYNGHGVPQPTQSGEIWVFNRGYTQYIPISLYDLQTWLGAPCVYVFDCAAAGNIIENFKRFVQKRIDDDSNGRHDISAPSPTASYIESIQLGACRSNETLPLNPDLPADLFTCCLTCPIEISVKWFILMSPLNKHHYYDILKNKEGTIDIPGKLTDRRTPLGELNWIFTAITDTIAWTSLSRPLFKKLFRQDLMVAALFRNFLLAKRIMPVVGCNPISDPPLPDINNHSMWESWDLAIDQVLSQLIKNKKTETISVLPDSDIPQFQVPSSTNLPQQNGQPANVPPPNAGQFLLSYQHSSFFEQHLTAFEIWLQYGSSTKEPPEQLPVVLQVLLSQAHRLRALVLLSRFLDLGPWAVYLALSIGIFPYILKLLQSPAPELRPVLTFIWARIMSIDYKNTQQELCKDKGYMYFVSILSTQNKAADHLAQSTDLNFEERKAMSAFILSLFVKDFKTGQKLCFSPELISTCLQYMENSDHPLLRQWCALLVAQLWDMYPDARWISYKDGYLDRLIAILNDPIPEVRASIILALTNFLPANDAEEKEASIHTGHEELGQQEIKLAIEMLNLISDGSPLIRREVSVFFSKFVLKYLQFFIVSAFGQLEEEITLIDNPNLIDEVRRQSPAYGTIFSSTWKVLLILSEDPHNEVKDYAEQVVDFVLIKLNESPLHGIVKDMEQYLLQKHASNINEGNGIPRKNTELGARRTQSLMMSKPNDSATNMHADRRVTSTASTASTSSISSITERLRSSVTLNAVFRSLGLSSEEGSQSTTTLRDLLPQSIQPMVGYNTAPRPTTPRFKPHKKNVRGISLPLQSKFFEYSCEYFQEPQIGNADVDEPGSEEYTRRLWRRNRNENIIAMTQVQKELAVTGNWTNNIATLDNKTQPRILKFTQFENYVVATDERDNITCWDWEKQVQMSRFSNGNPFGTKITDVKLLNEDDIPLLLTGSSDGVVKIYKNFHSLENFQLITAWRALTDILLTSRSMGLISEWQQSRGCLLVSGDVKIIRVWDAPRERCVVDIPARSTSSITSLTSDQVAGSIFVGGFGDGSLRVYDRRLDSRDSMVRMWKARPRSGMITNVHMQRGGYRELVSGTSDGQVNLWDIRLAEPVVSFKAFERSMTSAMIHEHAPVIACGSREVSMYNTAGNCLSVVKNPHAYLPTRTSSYLSSLTLHPHRMMMATNYNQDSHINVYQCDVVEEYL
ncbi:unnamed protein product [Kuraishia capsulata CBS 1993]|uniref:Raptor N-terminal CASPase-like domain-containing protein n=1 Tax=Kuraishia capsulata CBS 1993 TaxID=1382522 RepID=W6MPG2_9ASCO|nr:uncharacterized protein KUCA_T00004567001 [Kuraishia capsulata CBS 1993]CDK28584.1 unnamed protein product [Kuraishia capsulata CBS 1993]